MSRFKRKIHFEQPSELPPLSFNDIGSLFESLQIEKDAAEEERTGVKSSESKKDNTAKRFLSSLYSYLERPKVIEERSSHRVKGLHASQLASECPRASILTEIALIMSGATLEVKSEIHKAGSSMTQDLGHMIHDWWQNNYLGPAGLLYGDWKCVQCHHVMRGCKPEKCEKCEGGPLRYKELKVHIEDGIELHGHTDGIVLDIPWDVNSKKRIFELKTKRHKSFTDIKAPEAKHVVQVHSYMKGLKLDEAIIVYVNKDLQCSWRREDGLFVPGPPKVKAFLVKFDKKLWSELEIRAKEFHDAERRIEAVRVKGEDPKILLNPNDFTRICDTKICNRARSCAVVDLCFDV